MDEFNNQNQELEDQVVTESFWSARFIKFFLVFLGIIGLVSGGYWIWFNYQSAMVKTEANYGGYRN
jgi:hypothetical protein